MVSGIRFPRGVFLVPHLRPRALGNDMAINLSIVQKRIPHAVLVIQLDLFRFRKIAEERGLFASVQSTP